MAKDIGDLLRERRRKERLLDEAERKEEEEGVVDLGEEEGRTGVTVRNELEEAPRIAANIYDSVSRFIRTTQGLAIVGLFVALLGGTYYGLLTTNVVLTPEYQTIYGQLQEFEKSSSYLERMGIPVKRSQDFLEKENKVEEAVRMMNEFNSKGLSVKGVEDIHPGLTNKRKVFIWKEKYDRWYSTPRTMDEMFYYSLPFMGVALLLSIPFFIAQVVRGGRTFTVTNHATGEKSTYMIDEALVGNVYDDVLHVWRLPVVSPLTLSFTGQYDIVPDDAFITQVRKGMRAGGIYAEPVADVLSGHGGRIRKIFRSIPNEHGYFGELGFQKEVNYIKNVDELRQDNIEVKRLKNQREAQLYNFIMMTFDEGQKFSKRFRDEAIEILKEISSIRGSGIGEAKKKYKKKGAATPENEGETGET